MNWFHSRKITSSRFGSLIHECLEMWHSDRGLPQVLDHIDAALPNRTMDEAEKSSWHLARAMMSGYAARYRVEDFEVIALEKTFTGRIINPATGAAFPHIHLSGQG